MKIPSNILTLIAGITITLVSIWYGQNHGLMPIQASAEATEVDGIFNFMMTVSTVIFLIVEGAIIFSAIQFRKRKGDTTDGPPIEGNVPLEILWTAIPTVVVFILAVYSFEVYNNMGGLDPMVSHDHGQQQIAHQEKSEPGKLVAVDLDSQKLALGIGSSDFYREGEKAPVVVNVNAIQYAWIFTYEDTGIVSGDLHIPIGRPIKLNLTAGDVIHSFWLPEFRIKQDAIPGRESNLIFTANREGSYPINCAELCGAYHGAMKTMLYVQSEQDYKQWIQENTLAQTQNLEETVALNESDSLK